MKKSIKKIIAREFLFALSTVILFFVLLITFNSISDNHMDDYYSVENEIEELQEAPYNEMPYRLRIYYYFKNEFGAYDLVKEIEGPNTFLEQLEDDTYALTCFQLLEKHYPSEMNFKKYKENISKDKAELASDKYVALINLKEEELSEFRSSFFYSNNIEEEGIFFFLIALLFGFRYLIYATTWSIRQVRTA